AHLSDGSQQEVSATWDILDNTVAGLDTLTGASISVTGLKQGSTTVEATYDTWHVSVTITVAWAIPTDPGPVYFLNNPDTGSPGSAQVYPSPGAPATELYTFPDSPCETRGI